LLNRFMARQVSIVAPKPQTTRHRILGILNGEGFQVLFLDTPGILKPTYKLQELMEKEIGRALEDADVVLSLVDATAPNLPDAELLAGRKVIVAVNKTDKAGKEELASIARQVAEKGFERVFMVSALKGDGVEELKQALIEALPAGQPFYPCDQISERSERFFAAEIVREAIFNLYGAEVPYATTVVVDEFAERPGRKDYIRAVIYVERSTQKAIIIGKNGAALKKAGSIARRKIEEFLGRPVYLELWVKVAEAWRKNETFIRQNIYQQTQ